jgi:phosphate-selective porin OprO and OprP
MKRTNIIRALLAGSALFMSTAALAQEPEAQPDTSDATADAAIAEAKDLDDAQAKIELLQAQVEALQESISQIQAAQAKVTPSWKGAPQLEDKEAGWSFKVRGRVQYDVGVSNNPNDAIVTHNLGFNARARRIRLGAEGTIPGGLGYKCEADFANASVGFGDCIISYTPKNAPINIAIGNQETNNGLEQMTSSRFSSFVERAAFDDAFIDTRRIGINLGYINAAGDFRINGGLWAAHSIDNSLDQNGWIGGMRTVYSPLMGANQLHFGANFQYRKFSDNDNLNGSSNSPNTTPQGAPSTNQVARYRARPFTQLTDIRFVDTGNYAAKSDYIIGLEAAGIFKSFHVAAEGQYLHSNAYSAGDTITFDPLTDDPVDVLDQFASPTFVPDGNPSYWGGYIEAGYFITGETRGYKNGLWDRTKVLKPFSQGGMGAFQVIGRVDYLDLDSKKLRNGCTNNFITGACVAPSAATLQGKGGKQLGLLAGLTWIPEDYARVLLNYSHAFIEGGPFAAQVKPDSSKDINKRKYGNNTVQMRFQVDF